MCIAPKPCHPDRKAEHAAVPVRSAGLSDLDALVALEQRGFDGDRLSRAQYRRHLRSHSAQVLIADESGETSGSAVVFFRRTSRRARLYSLAVAGPCRGRGVGIALLNAVIEVATSRGCCALRLEVRRDNTAAIGLYERLGFVKSGEIAAYYEDDADACRYELAL